MTESGPDRIRSEKEIFFEAMEKTTPEEREAFLDGACGCEPVLRQRVSALLAEHFDRETFMAGPALRSVPDVFGEAPLSEGPGSMIGRYKLLQKLGEGGFGVVYMAEQQRPVRRRVAIKIIKLGMDTKEVVARFEAERQALAMMEHPSIAKVLDAGATDTGRPYFVMELVRGIPITHYCDANTVTQKERLALFIEVCNAVQHAHQKGIIHRDLKPSNILVTLQDGRPVPKIIDFGIAKATQQQLTDKTLFTRFEQFIGTPAYMSPEQADLSPLDIDTRSDIYSLGVLLYELLVGTTPFDARELLASGYDGIRQRLRNEEPLRPSRRLSTMDQATLSTVARHRQVEQHRLAGMIRGELDWIALKAIDKDRSRRYQTANALVMDIRRHLNNERVLAVAPSAIYLMGKYVRRHRLALSVVGAMLSLLAIGSVAIMFLQYKANQDYRRRLYVADIGRAGSAWIAGQGAAMLEFLNQCPEEYRRWEWDFLRSNAQSWNATVLYSSALPITNAWQTTDGQLTAFTDGNGLQVLDTQARRVLWTAEHTLTYRSAIKPSPDAEQVAISVGDGDGTIGVWRLRSGRKVNELKTGQRVNALAWMPDGKRLVSAGDDSAIRIWGLETSTQSKAMPQTESVTSLATGPDGLTIAAGYENGRIRIMDSATGAVKQTLVSSPGVVRLLEMSPDGELLATSNFASGGYRVDDRLWHVEGGWSTELRAGGGISSFRFRPGGHQLMTSDGSTGRVGLWDLDQGAAEMNRVLAHGSGCNDARFLPDGRILSAGQDGTIKIWSAVRPGTVRLKGHGASLRSIAISPNGRWLLSAGMESRVFLWDIKSGQGNAYTGHSRPAPAVAFSADSRFAASASEDGEVQVWDPITMRLCWTTSLAPAAGAWWLAFTPNGKWLLAAGEDGVVTVLDAPSGSRIGQMNLSDRVRGTDGMAVSPDGRLMALCEQERRLTVWHLDDLKHIWSVPANPFRSVAFSPNGLWIATGNNDGTTSLWEINSQGGRVRTLRGHGAAVTGVAFSPDGKRIFTSSRDGSVKVWDGATDTELLTIPSSNGTLVWHLTCSSDGRTVAAAGGDGIVTVWKAE